MREYDYEMLPVFKDGTFIDDVSYIDLIKFVNRKERGENFYYHKVNFDLGSAILQIKEARRKKQRLSIGIAAGISVFLLGITWLYFGVPVKHQQNNTYQIVAGSDKAILSLPEGKQVVLSDEKDGVVLSESGFEVLKSGEGKIIYRDLSVNSPAVVEHTVTTPRGGKFQLVLSDGTKIWLNAGSSIKFPASFRFSGSRKISLSGEAYFEVAKDAKRSFLVLTKGQQVAVLGTHFSVSAYPDDRSVKTMLLEGSVRIDPTNQTLNSTFLKPNQQAVLSMDRLSIKEMDPEEAIDWKNGDFIFRKEPLEQVMRKIARWYDVEVVYESEDLGKISIGGFFSRSEQIKDVLTLKKNHLWIWGKYP